MAILKNDSGWIKQRNILVQDEAKRKMSEAKFMERQKFIDAAIKAETTLKRDQDRIRPIPPAKPSSSEVFSTMVTHDFEWGQDVILLGTNTHHTMGAMFKIIPEMPTGFMVDVAREAFEQAYEDDPDANINLALDAALKAAINAVTLVVDSDIQKVRVMKKPARR